MTYVKDLTQLSDVTRDFINLNSPAARLIRNEVVDPLRKIGKVYVIGGLIRDLACFGKDDRPISDIDLVVSTHPKKLQFFAEGLGAIPNRFGGYGLKTKYFKVDFWAFTNTWAKKANAVKVKHPKDLWRTTFFDWDAVVYSIEDNKTFAIPRYIDRLSSKKLDINLEPNPSVQGNLVRSLRRLMMWDATPSARLLNFIKKEAIKYSWLDLVEIEDQAFNAQYLKEFETFDAYLTKVINTRTYDFIGRHDRRQLQFPGWTMPVKLKPEPDAKCIQRLTQKQKLKSSHIGQADLLDEDKSISTRR